jgi:hypothetical protein
MMAPASEHITVERPSGAPPLRLRAPATCAAGRIIAQAYRPGVG